MTQAGIVATYLVMFAIIPIWVLAGFADYFCHRASDIETTAGPYESLLHLLGFGIIGVPVLLALFFDINALIICIMAVCILIHHGIVAIDLTYANSTREVSPLEQMIHSFLEIVPITAFLLIVVIHSEEVRGILASTNTAPDYSLTIRHPMLPASYIVGLLAAVVLFNLIPFVEELIRGIIARHKSH